jgi:hypothetical protein
MSRNKRKRGLPIHDGHQARVRQIGQVTGTYQIKGGRRLHITALPPMLVWSIQAARRPNAPMVEMEGLGGVLMRTPDMTDPGYQAQLAEWEDLKQFRLARLLYLLGVQDNPTPQEAATIQTLLNEYDPTEVKFHWVASLFRSEDDLTGLMEAVFSLSIPTEEGMQDAEALFPGAVPNGQGTVEAAGRVALATEP